MVGVVMASVSPLAAVTQFRRRAALNRSSPCEYSLAGVETWSRRCISVVITSLLSVSVAISLRRRARPVNNQRHLQLLARPVERVVFDVKRLAVAASDNHHRVVELAGCA